MTFDVRAVEGREFSAQAADVLNAAWNSPAMLYTEAYLRWQFTFPGDAPNVCVAAFDGREPIGFAGFTTRRLRGAAVKTHAVVSFVAVAPTFRRQHVATALYALLLRHVRELDLPVLTFAVAASPGERTLLRGYAEAGFSIRPAGRYPTFAWVPISDPPALVVHASRDIGDLRKVLAKCRSANGFFWHDPTEEQLKHYFGDPRFRKLLIVYRHGEPSAAGWIVEVEHRVGASRARTMSLESVFLPNADGEDCEALLHAALRFARSRNLKPVVAFTNVLQPDQQLPRVSGLRQTGVGFVGYSCSAAPVDALRGCNLEII